MRSKNDLIDKYSDAEKFPPSPRDSKLRNLEVAAHIIFLLAGFCAWQIGSWWGIGLVASLYLINIIETMTSEEYRQELVELHSKLSLAILRNSDILDETFDNNAKAVE